MFEYVFLDRAREQYEALSPDEQEDVDRAIRLLELDLWHDGITKRDLPVPPLILSVSDDGRWRMSYRVLDHRFVEIDGIGRVQRA